MIAKGCKLRNLSELRNFDKFMMCSVAQRVLNQIVLITVPNLIKATTTDVNRTVCLKNLYGVVLYMMHDTYVHLVLSVSTLVNIETQTFKLLVLHASYLFLRKNETKSLQLNLYSC